MSSDDGTSAGQGVDDLVTALGFEPTSEVAPAGSERTAVGTGGSAGPEVVPAMAVEDTAEVPAVRAAPKVSSNGVGGDGAGGAGLARSGSRVYEARRGSGASSNGSAAAADGRSASAEGGSSPDVTADGNDNGSGYRNLEYGAGSGGAATGRTEALRSGPGMRTKGRKPKGGSSGSAKAKAGERSGSPFRPDGTLTPDPVSIAVAEATAAVEQSSAGAAPVPPVVATNGSPGGAAPVVVGDSPMPPPPSGPPTVPSRVPPSEAPPSAGGRNGGSAGTAATNGSSPSPSSSSSSAGAAESSFTPPGPLLNLPSAASGDPLAAADGSRPARSPAVASAAAAVAVAGGADGAPALDAPPPGPGDATVPVAKAPSKPAFRGRRSAAGESQPDSAALASAPPPVVAAPVPPSVGADEAGATGVAGAAGAQRVLTPPPPQPGADLAVGRSSFNAGNARELANDLAAKVPQLVEQGLRGRSKVRARKVRRVVRHIDPWSVLVFSVLFHLCVFTALLLSSVLVWNAAVAAGTIQNIENFIRQLGDYQTFTIDGGAVLRAALIVAAVLTLASSVMVVLLTVVFNLISDLVGGIRVTVVEEETVRVNRRRSQNQ